eukprot:CAMPEP_0119115244 /NCGR_PEP_ID=MMETSP1180-20130426/50278_1 /TAXON_ID=3052 ORGANISM="Chlamydomonas cf sp, Strain CCMP681" /NCGR_SAMPLE_ID=MMETSP1180 /ASSEMBLY_ACC=CAM_ASM_000741 /LENGTH=43 /DNA_ID= /DNA_START= /DNA_END= /DNA_ORIENTATION=
MGVKQRCKAARQALNVLWCRAVELPCALTEHHVAAIRFLQAKR